MTVAIVVVPLFIALCVVGYFLVGRYDKFLHRNKNNRRAARSRKRRGK